MHLETNDTKFSNSYKILQIKTFVKEKLLNSTVFISRTILHADDGKTRLAVSQFNNHILHLKSNSTGNKNITGKHLGSKGLGLNDAYQNLLARNLNIIKRSSP